MKKIIIILLLVFVNQYNVNAQEFTYSYSCTGVATSMGPQAPPPGLATWIEFYDDYILVMGIEKFKYGGKNFDGSIKYMATKQGPPALNTIGWVVNKDYSAVKQVIQSTVMGMTMQMEYRFSYIGEGSEPAQFMMENAGSSYSDDDDDEPTTCYSCYGNGSCKSCNGSGRDSYMRNGKCGVCRGTGRCVGCNGKGVYR